MTPPLFRRRLLTSASSIAWMTATLALTVAAPAMADTDPAAPIATYRYRSPVLSGGSDAVQMAVGSGAPVSPNDPETFLPPDAPVGMGDTGAPHLDENGSTAAQDLPGAAQVLVPLDAPLNLNGRFVGVISVLVDQRGAGEIDAPRFLALISPVLEEARRQDLQGALAGRVRVPIASLTSAGMQVRFDTGTISVEVTLDGQSLLPQDMALAAGGLPPDPADYPQPARFSAGLNIGVAESYDHGGGDWAPLRGAVDLLAHFGGFGGVTLVAGADYIGGDADGAWRRREARLVKDFYASAIRLEAGEFTPAAESFQGAGRLAGIGFERAYSTIRPFQNIRPTGRQTFSLDRESTVDVVINGLTTQTLRLAAGRYALSDFPFVTGANDVQLVVADQVFGRREIARFDLFNGSELLGRGVSEFGAWIGRYEGARSFAYDGPWLTTGYYRRGVTDALTLGANAQLSENGGQIGAAAVWPSPLGLVRLETAASLDRAKSRSGFAAAIALRKDIASIGNGPVRVTGSARYVSESFSDAFFPDRANPEAWRLAAFVQWQGPWETGLSIGGGWARSRVADRDAYQADLGLSRAFGPVSVVANLSYSQDEAGRKDTRVNIGLTIPIGPRWNSSGRYDSRANRSEFVVSRYSRGGVGDLSGEVRLTRDDADKELSGRVDYIGNRFEAELVHDRRYDTLGGGQTQAQSRISVNTFVGYADGAIAIGRPIRDGFVIAAIHSSLATSRVRLTSGEQTIAKSDFLGSPVAPLQRAYGVNRMGVEIDPLPEGYDLGSGSLNIFPVYGGGYRLPVGSDASRIVVGVAIGPAGLLALCAGSVTASAPNAPAKPVFTNRAGRFVADGLAPAHYTIELCGLVADVTLTPAQQGIIDVGSLVFQAR